jgi:hypothetical protein
MQWQRYGKVVGKRTMVKIESYIVVRYDTSTLELLDYLHPRLKDFVTHNFIAKW